MPTDRNIVDSAPVKSAPVRNFDLASLRQPARGNFTALRADNAALDPVTFRLKKTDPNSRINNSFSLGPIDINQGPYVASTPLSKRVTVGVKPMGKGKSAGIGLTFTG